VAVEADGLSELSTSERTADGVATPIVSARTISSASSCAASSTTAPGSTSPSNGHPKATLIVAVVGQSAAARIRWTRSSATVSEALPFRRLNVSVAASVTLRRSRSVCRNRS
jgi:hypothetical protein